MRPACRHGSVRPYGTVHLHGDQVRFLSLIRVANRQRSELQHNFWMCLTRQAVSGASVPEKYLVLIVLVGETSSIVLVHSMRSNVWHSNK